MSLETFLTKLMRTKKKPDSPPQPRRTRRNAAVDLAAIRKALAGGPLTREQVMMATGISESAVICYLDARGAPFERCGRGWQYDPYTYRLRE